MEIDYRTGDLLEAPLRVIVHGCNAQGVMGSGIARDIRARWPVVYESYRRIYDTHGLTLGSVIWVATGDKLVGNAITQEFYGRDRRCRYVDYDAVRKALREINAWVETAQDHGGEGRIAEIGFPLIGAERGGGRWPVIAEIIETESLAFRPIVYTLDGIIPI